MHVVNKTLAQRFSGFEGNIECNKITWLVSNETEPNLRRQAEKQTLPFTYSQYEQTDEKRKKKLE